MGSADRLGPRSPAVGTDLPLAGPASTLHAFLTSVRERAATVAATDEIVQGHPFLTVVVRTQGRRPETLRDALLCLQAQTDQDFDVLVTVHHGSPDGILDVEAAIDSMPASLRSRVRMLRVASGGRARPLNEAFAAARGRYVAFLDDDDLVLGHWVERFSVVAGPTPGPVLRAVCVEQAVDAETWPGGRPGIRGAGPLVHRYPATFDLVDHLAHNRTPFMAYAFPREVFHRLGVRFDESLDICEDWDFELRAVLLVGVVAAEAVTCVYRRWLAADSSYTRHTAQEWRRTEADIIGRLDASPQLFPPGSISRLREVAQLKRVLSTHDASGAEDLLATIDRLEATVAEYESSRSWKITRPLRAATSAAARRRRRG